MSIEEREEKAEDIQSEIEDLQFEIDKLEDMYKKAQELVELNKLVNMDMDYEDIRDEIDNEITKRKDAIKENEELIEDILSGNTYEDNCRALNNEYLRSVL